MNAASIGRRALVLVGIVPIVLSLVGILSVGVAGLIGAAAFFLAATNFGRSCPLLLSVRSLLTRKRSLKGEGQE